MRSLGTRFLLPFGVVAVLFSIFSLYRVYAVSSQHADDLISRQAALALEFNLAIREYAGEKIRPVMERLVDKNGFVPETMSTSFISRSIFEEVRKKFPEYVIHFASDQPRNPINRANADELRMIEYFRKNPSVTRKTEEIQINGRRYLAHFSPKWMTRDCMRCHGDPKDAPAELLKRYGATASFHRTLGDVAGLDTVAIPLDTAQAALFSEMHSQSLALAAGLTLLFGAIMLVFRSVVTRRLAAMASHFQQIATHPDSRQMTQIAVTGNDEISVVGRAFNALAEELHATHVSQEQRVTQRTAELTRANAELTREIAERQRAEASLRKTTEELDRFFDVSPDLLCIADSAGRFQRVNLAWEQTLGYARDELLTKPLLDIVHPDDLASTRVATDLASRQSVPSFANRIRCKGGSYRWIEWNAVPAGTMIFAAARDITERKRAEEALATRTRQLEALRAIGAEIARELDLQKVLTLIAQRAVELVGADADSLWLWDESDQTVVAESWHGLGDWMAGRRLQAGEGLAGSIAEKREGLMVNDYRTSAYALAVVLAETQNTASLGEPLLFRDQLLGALVLDRRAGRPPFSETDQQTLRLFATQAAIAIENARLFQQEQTRRRQIEAVRAITAEITRELDLPRLLNLLIARAAELVGASSGTVYLWDPEPARVVPVAWHGLGEWQAEIQHPLGGGIAGTVAQTRQGLCSNDYRTSPFANPVTLRQTQVTAFLGEPLLYRDTLIGAITLNHEDGRRFTAQDQELLRLFAAQAAIAIENARLFDEQQRAFLDLQRAQEELVRSQKLRGLGQMAAGIAHDLNNMLAAILGQVELLKLRGAPPGVREGLDVLETAATDGAQVVRRLQDFARQRTISPLAPMELGQAIREALELTRPRWEDEMQRRGVRITVRSALAELPPVLGYPPEVREVLTNLIFNAVDAMPDGGTLSFAARVNGGAGEGAKGPGEPDSPAHSRAPAPSQPFVELTVTDTGVGMSEEVRQQALEPFFTTKGVRGTGLGLSVVYGIMERHGGKIAVASTLGQGTTIALRFQTAQQEALASIPSPVVPAHPLRVLLIDDESAVRTTLATLLRTAGHSVVEADSGAIGLAIFAETSVDCVLTDLGMPDLTGWDVARAVKAKNPAFPVVLLTGWGEGAVGEADGRALVDRVLGKPVRLTDLLHVIAEICPAPAGQEELPPGLSL
jgi:PAS domain S-box-containing protein